MQVPVVMPKIGLTMTEGKIVEWRKSAGDPVRKDEILFVFETEKVTFEVEAQGDGFVAEIISPVEEVVPVGNVVAFLSDDKSASDTGIRPGAEPATVAAMPVPGPAVPTPVASATTVIGKVRATPLARRIARDNGLDLADIASTGGSRLKARDVRAAIEARVSAAGLAEAPQEPRAAEGRLVRLTGMRRTIARRMLASKVETAQAYMTMAMDATRLVEARAMIAPLVEAEAGIKPTITDMLLKVTAHAIRKHPVMNTRWTDDGILWLDRIDMGMALGLEDGLVVPVIRDTDTLSVAAIAAARSGFVRRGKVNQLAPDELHGSSFSLSSLGMYGVEEFNSILNQPEAGILAVGAIIDTPVAVDGQVVIRPMMKLTLTYDHRIIDGAKAGAFMKTLKDLVENPILVIA